MDEPMICGVCKEDLRTGAHNLEKHRDAMYSNVDEGPWRGLADEKSLDESIKRHPGGNKLRRNKGKA